MSEMLEIMKEFFNMPLEERAVHYSEDLCKPVRLFTSTGVHDIVRLWRDCLRMAISPVENFKQYWPEKPSNLKKTVERYAVEMKGLTEKIFVLITEGLGLEYDYLNGGLSGQPMVSHVNYYPPCPDPSLTLGLAKHCDPGLVTLLLQGDVSGLQILCNGEWQAVDPVPNAIIVIYGHQMEFVTNGELKSVEHRAITNDMLSRISIATFIQPAMDCLVAPAKKLLDEKNPPLYKSFLFGDYFANYVANLGDKSKVTEHFQNTTP
ncbi:2'-deoxymugineic-acid 2'-dioxygenase [Dendrobium catenatum]|uniref:2'-deoxymugineic-acid 2'-dioxygenase n=1 Tax=Dendrobium catenatum TaxID=906689 RepID=A0A2I0WD87_9ASPA|nr:2'-deoxymugineic-acid 2'-dioxygenase [Dendrobium catenatum]PKU73613.1 2'-deoxymugineic-acid 2'-dioxygenase [Dendrobium catenatum]